MEIRTRAELHQNLYDAILCNDSPSAMEKLWQLYRDAVNNEHITNNINPDHCIEEIRTIFTITITSIHNINDDWINLINKFDLSTRISWDKNSDDQKYYDNKLKYYQKIKETLEYIQNEASSLKVFLQLISKQKGAKADEEPPSRIGAQGEGEIRIELYHKLYDAIADNESRDTMFQLWQSYQGICMSDYKVNNSNEGKILTEIEILSKNLKTSLDKVNTDIYYKNIKEPHTAGWSSEAKTQFNDEKIELKTKNKTLKLIIDEANALRDLLQKSKRESDRQNESSRRRVAGYVDSIVLHHDKHPPRSGTVRGFSNKENPSLIAVEIEKPIGDEKTETSISEKQTTPEPRTVDKLDQALIITPLTKKSKRKKNYKATPTKRRSTDKNYKKYSETYDKHYNKSKSHDAAVTYTMKQHDISEKTVERAREATSNYTPK